MTVRDLYTDIYPNLLLDFANVKALDPRVTFARASSAVVVDPTGVYREVTSNVPRFDHDPVTGESLGLLIEEQRTNSIRNPRGEGAVAGTPGTTPTNWAVQTVSGVLTTVVGFGTEDGISYVDIRYAGTNSGSTGFPTIFFESIGGIAASASQVWSGSLYARLIAGALPTSVTFSAWELDVSNAYLRNTSFSAPSFTPTTAALKTQRVLAGSGTTGANTTSIRPLIAVTVNSGQAVDFTLRIGWLQLELGAFATSPILPPVGSPAQSTRAADAANMTGTNFSSWYRHDQGTFVIESRWFIVQPAVPISYSFLANKAPGGSTTTGGIGIWNWSGNDNFNGYIFNDSGVIQFSPGITPAESGSTLTTMTKQALAYRVNDAVIAANGFVDTTDTSVTLPTNLTTLNIGFASSSFTSQYVKRLIYYPARLTTTELQAISR